MKIYFFKTTHTVFIGLGICIIVIANFAALYIKVPYQYAQTAPTATAIPTYQSIGLYWSPSGGSATVTCDVKYRVQGATTWNNGLPLWYDDRAVGGRPVEYRGSIVLLQPGTTYEIQLTLSSGTTTTLTATTWTDTTNLPIAQTVTVPSGSSAYTITQGGTATGYILYTAAAGGTTIDVAHNADNDVVVSANYVIVRGLTLKGGGTNGILLSPGAHDVIIEKNDISAWGHICSPAGYCGEEDSAVRSEDSVSKITIQRNIMHDPAVNSNNYCEPSIQGSDNHPNGGRSIGLEGSPTNIVIRYNEQYGDINHAFEDGMGANDNFSYTGWPGQDSDINGNIVSDVIDDGIEVEGGDMNVRVWGNFIDKAFTGVSSTRDTIGPLYIFRNIMARSEKCARQNGGYTTGGEHGPFDKVGDLVTPGGGRRYLFHNTLLQTGGGMGPNLGPADYGDYPMTNTMSRNNIWNGNGGCYSTGNGGVNDIDYDLCPGGGGIGSHSVTGAPVYVSGGGDSIQLLNSGVTLPPGSSFALSPSSPGYHAGQVIPNFNDDFGAQPDMGAESSGGPKMEFGVNAYMNTTTVTPQPGISSTPGATTPTSSVGTTPLSIALCPHGIGRCGDSINPGGVGTSAPAHTTRNVTVTLVNQQNQAAISGAGTVQYNQSAQNFQGTVSLGGVTSGQYMVSIKMDGYKTAQVVGVISVTTGQAVTLPSQSLIAGDINNDGHVDISDYNLLIGCYGTKQGTASCISMPTATAANADIDDNGSVKGSDLNLFFRELSVTGGQ